MSRRERIAQYVSRVEFSLVLSGDPVFSPPRFVGIGKIDKFNGLRAQVRVALSQNV